MNKWKKQFAIIYTGQAFSLLGSAAVQFAVIWWLTIQTKSAITLTVASIISFLPKPVENNVSISPYSTRILLELDNQMPSIPFPFENPGGQNYANITKCHEEFPRSSCLYRKPGKGFFKPSETPLFPTVLVGLTGFEPATFCFNGRFSR